MFVVKTRMATDRIPITVLFFLLVHFQLYHALHFAYSSPIPEILSSRTNLSHILQDVLEEISASENWNLEGVRISDVDVEEARYDTSQTYEFIIELDKNEFGTIKFSDEFVSWRKFRKPKSDLSSLLREATSLAVVDTLEIEGPLELRVDPPHRLSLSLPMNITYTGLNRVLVGEGLILRVSKALEVSLHYSSSYDLPLDGSMTLEDLVRNEYRPFLWSTSCIQLVYVRISGAASLAARLKGNPDLRLRAISIAKEAILLLPEKSPPGADEYGKRTCPADSLSMRLSMGDKIWRSLIGQRKLRDPVTVSFEANTKVSAAVKFPIGLVRDLGVYERYEWSDEDEALHKRERHRIEWVRFELAAIVEADRLKPLAFQKSASIFYWQDVNSNQTSPAWDPHLYPFHYFRYLLF